VSVRVVAVAGMPEAATSTFDPAQDVLLDWESPRRNIHMGVDSAESGLGRPLHGAALDLLDVAATIVLGDQLVRRGRNEDWVRSIEFVIPVRRVALWRGMQSLMLSLLHLMTWDSITLRFEQREGPKSAERQPPPEWHEAVDCACLLSGGLDSFAGAVALLEGGRRPLFVTHRSANPTIHAAQRHVLDVLEREYAGLFRAVLVPLGTSRVDDPDHPLPPDEERETSQRARSLWYLALGAVGACVAGVEELFICENGVLAAHVPMTASRLGSLSTRTAHPSVLAMFREIAAEALSHDLEIINPFAAQTKAEVVGRILRRRIPEGDIRATESCWQSGRRPRPCGACVPCLMRQLALADAGLGQEACMVRMTGSFAATPTS